MFQLHRSLCLNRMRPIFQTSWPYSARHFCSASPPGGGDGDIDGDAKKQGGTASTAPPGPSNDEIDDGFGLDGFVTGEEVEREDREAADVASKLLADLADRDDVAPELASDLVNRMVQATSRALAGNASPRGQILDAISPHTVSVLRAARVSTNMVQAARSKLEPYPIEKRVTARMVIERLALSAPAREALSILAGPRFDKDRDMIALSCDQYPTKEENRAMIVTRMHRLVAAARVAVGESVDETPLRSWQEVADEVERQSDVEMAEGGSLSRVLGKLEA